MNLRVASLVAEQLKNHGMFADGRANSPHKKKKRLKKLGNFKRIPEIIWFDCECPTGQSKGRFSHMR